MAMTRTLISTLIAAAAVVGLCSVAPAASASGVMVGGYRPIYYVNDPHIQELGRWAVSEHVMHVRDGLVFSKVVSGMQQQVASGMNYRLVLVGTHADGNVAAYRTSVYEQRWTNTRVLTSFTSAN